MANDQRLQLPARISKPRESGLTAITDVRLPLNYCRSMLEDFNDFIDIAKFGIGVAYVLPTLKEKIALYQSYGIDVYFGGTLFEKFFHQKKIDQYVSYLKEHNITSIEVSSGTLDISLDDRLALVNELKGEFKVFVEVGSKDANAIMAPSQWIREINTLLDAGATYAITEGRDSGTAGIYRPSGELRTGLLSDIIDNTPKEKLIFEAPSPKLQMYFINLIGVEVNLGNVNPFDVLILETQRRGLRSETFYLE